jgi:hypothetical protein
MLAGLAGSAPRQFLQTAGDGRTPQRLQLRLFFSYSSRVPSSLQVHTAASLRDDLNARARGWALARGARHELTTGRSPSVIFGADEAGGHGNFHPASYQAIDREAAWARRLSKVHTASVRALPRANWRWRELDCASSSDALLMNIFCHPETLHCAAVRVLLGADAGLRPVFGVRARVPLASGRVDTTEIDMRLGALLVEAKLTEVDFQTARPALVERYRDLHAVFHVDQLPRTRAVIVGERWDEGLAAMVPVKRGVDGNLLSYQLVRGVLATLATESAYCVICDQRREDLIEAWHRVQQAVRSAELRCRLQLLTWQELARVLSFTLQDFLALKYGIEAA